MQECGNTKLEFVEARVYKISECLSEDVYNLEVDGVHNFFAEGICVHNCESYNTTDDVEILYQPTDSLIVSESLDSYLESLPAKTSVDDILKSIQQKIANLIHPLKLCVKLHRKILVKQDQTSSVEWVVHNTIGDNLEEGD